MLVLGVAEVGDAQRLRSGRITGTVRVRVIDRSSGKARYREAETAAGVAVYVPDFATRVVREPDEAPVLALREEGPWPVLLPVQVGDTVEITNLDARAHEPFSPSASRRFDLGWLAPHESARVKFERPGLVQVFCNAHPDEVAYVLVTPSPAAVVTRDDGAFVLSGVPAGRHRVVAWAPQARPVVRTVEVPAAGEVNLALTVDLTLEVGPHRDKHGLRYPGEIERDR